MGDPQPPPSHRDEPPAGPGPRPGELFARRYRIDRLLGRGATGSVWAVVDEEVGDRVALKLLTANPDDAAERFRREVRLARRVTHRNAARIFDLGTVDGVLYLTMELVEGDSLKQIISREAPLSVPRSAGVASQIAAGLQAAHDVGVVHRDIKPANVLIDATGRVVLTDFGLARGVAGDSKVTIDSAMIGTPSYMAPEQVRGETVGPATDLYALGVMLYEMLTGRCPFVREGVVATAMARLSEDPEDPRSIVPIPDDIAQLVLECLERAAERRPSSAERLAERLAEMAEREETPDTAATLIAAPSSSPADPRSTSDSSSARSGRATSSSFVTIAPEERTLAVLPFRHRGAAEHAHFAETMAEELVDVLTTIRGLRVTASGATAKYEGQAVDPREAGRELGVDAIVEGTVRVSGSRLRISARLVDVVRGEQLWVDRFDGDLADALELEEITARRIAESLRRELELLSARHSAPEEAIELYLEAKSRAAILNMDDESLNVTLELLERAIEIAPHFGLAVALHADQSVRRWFLPAQQGDATIAQRAHESVARAIERAPQVALTHFAAGRLAVSDGRFGDAARELTLALTFAPTDAAIHEYLGMLQCEAGRGDEGERHIEIARQLDPSLPPAMSVARRRALARDREALAEMIAKMRASTTISRFLVESFAMRVAGWFGDTEAVRECRPSAILPRDHPTFDYFEALRAALLGETTAEKLLESLERLLESGSGPRFNVFMRQLAIEVLAPLGAHDLALEQLRIAADTPAFVDTDWLERCPALDSLRGRRELGPMIVQVRRRADAIWRMRAS